MQQFLLTGYNGFGQHTFKGSNIECTSGFLEITVPFELLAEAREKLVIKLCWRYTAYALGNKLCLQGLLSESRAQQLHVEAPAAIKAVAGTDYCCLLLLDNGQLYKLETKLNATLQPVTLEAAPTPTPRVLKTPQKRSILGQSKTPADTVITHIACGPYINVAISASNAVYSIPSFLHQFPMQQWRVQQLVCGSDHALLLNGNGDVYAWGNGLRGQLGQPTVGWALKPTLVDALAGIKITHIAAGSWHNAAISAFGDLYTWGLNCDGQQGMRVRQLDPQHSPTVYPLPQLHDLPACCEDNADAACQPQRVFAGSRHTIVQRSCGLLWASGWTAYGQLGIKKSKHRKNTDEFLPVSDSSHYKNSDVFCGPWATMLVHNK